MSRAGTRALALDDQQRLAALRALPHDVAIDPRLRLAGRPVALYAQPVARVVRLTGADLQLTEAGGRRSVSAGTWPACRLSFVVSPSCCWRVRATAASYPQPEAGQPIHPTQRQRARPQSRGPRRHAAPATGAPDPGRLGGTSKATFRSDCGYSCSLSARSGWAAP
jgi:hypothetical protein